MNEALKPLDRDELSILSEFGRMPSGWRTVCIFRSGGGQWMAAVRQRLKRKGLLESNPSRRRTWRITDAGRAALSTSNNGAGG